MAANEMLIIRAVANAIVDFPIRGRTSIRGEFVHAPETRELRVAIRLSAHPT